MSTSKTLKIGFAAGLLSFTLPVYSQQGTTWFGNAIDGQWLIGIKTGVITNDEPGFENAPNTSIVLGYQFAREVDINGSASIELEINNSQPEGIDGTGTEWEAETYALFLNYRSPGTVYAIGKLGIMDSEVETKTIDGVELKKISDTNFAYGLGAGVLLGETQNVNLELEWIGISGDNDLNLVNFSGLVRF